MKLSKLFDLIFIAFLLSVRFLIHKEELILDSLTDGNILCKLSMFSRKSYLLYVKFMEGKV